MHASRCFNQEYTISFDSINNHIVINSAILELFRDDWDVVSEGVYGSSSLPPNKIKIWSRIKGFNP